MSITPSELVWRKPQEVSAVSTNGGRMTSIVSPSNVKNNLFPDVPQAERTSGSVLLRKAFIHVANDADLMLIAPKVYIESRTPGDDNVVFIPATKRGRATNITGAEQKYGAGLLSSSASIAATTISVGVESAALAIFTDGMLIRISDRTAFDSAGNEEFVTISGAPSYAGNIATISFTPALENGYAATVTKVASVYLPGDVAASSSAFLVTSAAGTYNAVDNPILLDHIASVSQDWVLTFTSGTAFTISGDELGVVGTGNISSGASPTNPQYSKPYFTLSPAGFGGTYLSGNTISFSTEPAAIPIWYRREVPAGATSLSGNSVIVVVDGESS